MNCEDPKYIAESEKKFKNAKTIKEFLHLWSKFYNNEICIPTYLDVFVGGEDNEQATYEMGRKFQQIVKSGVIPHDFQVNDPTSQKAYVSAFAPSEITSYLTEYINRYPGFVAFYQDIESKDYPRGLYVTYDPDEAQSVGSRRMGVFMGDAFTDVGSPREEAFDFIDEWLSKPVRKILNKNNYNHLAVVDTQPNAKPDRILDVIINALNDNPRLVNRYL